ncbi:MAG: hypothetical protein ACOX0J_11345 [Thermoactinomyces vulgaris]
MIRSFGMSLLMMPIMTAGLNQLPEEMNGHGTAMANTSRQIAGSLGISVFTTIFSIRTQYHLGKLADQANMMDPAYSDHFYSALSGFCPSCRLAARTSAKFDDQHAVRASCPIRIRSGNQ